MDGLDLTSIFLACVQNGSFSAAARALSMSRSAVGKAVSRLEHQLGVRLFHRTTRSQSLTEEGQTYFEYARRALGELDAARKLLAIGRQEPTGVLRVTAPLSFGRKFVAPSLLGLTQAHPLLSLSMSFADRPVDLVDEGYDLAIRIGPSLDSAGIMGRILGRQQMKICAAPSYLERRGVPRSRDDLDDHDLLLYGRANFTRHWRMPDDRGEIRTVGLSRSVVRFDDLDALADAAARGYGVARLPCWLVSEHLTCGSLVALLPDDPQTSYDILLLWPQGQPLPVRVRKAIDWLSEAIPPLLSWKAPSGAAGLR
jgi:DNA-binding transcriptional LysR family regulator